MSIEIRKVGPIILGVEQEVFFYSLARHALSSIFTRVEAAPGQKILLPGFVCRDLLAAVNKAELIPVWYEISQDLKPAQPSSKWPSASFILAINYFGFPQDLTPFRAYAERVGAILIEDNAHGFMSRDVDGEWLGARASYGMFSLRKTIRMPDGAAMLINTVDEKVCGSKQLPFTGAGMNSAEKYKSKIREIPLIGRCLLRNITNIVRQFRRLHSGSLIPTSDLRAELEFPVGPNPWLGLLKKLDSLDSGSEIKRRRQIYAHCLAFAIDQIDVTPIFGELPDGCVPYGFPFRCNLSGRKSMQRLSDALGMDLITWPDLPSEITEHVPIYYRDVLMINFL
jgi:hypothetical protein